MREASMVLSADPSSVPAARRFVTTTLEQWGYDAASWAAAQIVSELAANCALHARTPYCVKLVQRGDGVRLEVADGSVARVQRRSYSTGSTTGRGLRLVEALAATWGVDAAATGKTVWVALELSADGMPATDGREVEADADVDRLLASFGDDEPGQVSAACLWRPELRAAA